ncbi:cupin domain-containing protein [Pelagerythrobacter sp.]|uniref:cupin domain-containing protein n=1 Tax=Pelagerythrobacter sp. TaxID=2800702 RepID=UPI0035B483D4
MTSTNSDPATGALAIDTSICLHQADLPDEVITLCKGVRAKGKLLNNAADGSLRSAILDFAGEEQLEWPSCSGTLQLFVLKGVLIVDGNIIGENGFAVLPGAIAHRIVALSGASVVAIRDVLPEGDCPEAVYIPDCFAVDPFVPTINGRLLEGFERRVLWLDPRTGADTRLLKVPGGFAGGGPNWHPVNEEIFCVSGDIQPDDTRPMRTGSYLLNPARSIHGFDERTEGGCVLLEWHDGPWDLISAPGAERLSR